MIDFSILQDLTIPEGLVIRIAKDDIILWERPSVLDYMLITGDSFRNTIPSTATSVVFTDVAAPATATLTDVSANGKGKVVSWLDGTTYYVSTQLSGKKIYANQDSSYMFATYDLYEDNIITNITLNNLDTSNVTDMSWMFSDCINLTSLDLSGFNTSNVTNMDMMFYNCNKLSEITLGTNFAWVGAYGYFPTPSSDYIPYADGYWYTEDGTQYRPSAIPSNIAATYYAVKPVQLSYELIDGLTFNNVLVERFGYEVVEEGPFPGFEETYIVNSVTSITFTDIVKPSNITSYDDLSADNDGSVIGWADGTTYTVSSQKSGQKILANEICSDMFNSCDNLTTLDLSNFNTSNVTNMNTMFAGCNNLSTLDVSHFNTSNVTDMSYMFAGCSSLTILDVSSFNTDKVIDMNGMFAGINLTTLDLSNFNTSNVKYMNNMFESCDISSTLDLSSFNTSNVTSMHSMFRYCINLSTLDLSSFNTSKVTDMYDMFADCNNLTTLNISSFDTSNVTNMGWMFYNCTSLTTLDISNFDTSKVTNMEYMFRNCTNLTTLDISNFDTTNVKNMMDMFCNCTNLTTLDLSNFNTSNVTNMNTMFYYCKNLTTIYASDLWNVSNVTNSSNMFIGCTKLKGDIAYNSSYVDKTYATTSGGYLTYKAAPST